MTQPQRNNAGILLVIGMVISSCAYSQPAETTTWTLTSPAFRHGELIPSQYTCAGGNVSPPLEWTAPPDGTKELALICDDPDAPVGSWLHWLIYHLSPALRGLPEAVPKDAALDDGTLQGINNFLRVGYGGPCPPRGATHRYRFTLYALDRALPLHPQATRRELEHAMEGHVVAQTELVGFYGAP